MPLCTSPASSLFINPMRDAPHPPRPPPAPCTPQVHSFLLQQQRLRRITSAALVLESAPEAFLLDVQQHLRPLLACLRELGLSQASSCRIESVGCSAAVGMFYPQSARKASARLTWRPPLPPSLPPSSLCRNRRQRCSVACGGSALRPLAS